VRIWNKSSATVSLTTPQGQVTVGIDDYVDLSAADLPVPFVLDPSPLVRQTLNVVDPEDSPYGKWALDATGGGSARLGATDQEVVSLLPTPMRPAVGSELPGQITQSAEEVACPVVVDGSDPYSPLLTFSPSGGSMRLAAVTLRAPGQTGPGGLSIGQAVANLLVSPGWTPDANKSMGEYPAFVYATGQGTEIIALTADGFVIAAIVKDEGNIVSTAAVSSAFAGCGVLGGVYGP